MQPSGPGDCGRRRGHAAGAHRGGQTPDDRRSQAGVPGARRQACGGEPRRGDRARVAASYAWDASPVSTARLCGGSLGADQERRLVAGLELLHERQRRLAAPALGFRQAVSVARPRGRRWHRLRRAGVGRRRARQQAPRPIVGGHPDRRRSDVRARRALDRGAPSHSAAERDEQQPRLPHGDDARAAHVQRPATAASIAGRSAARSPIPTSTTRRWRRAWASTPRGRSTIRADLGPALKRAIAVVKRGEPALVDVVTQVR